MTHPKYVTHIWVARHWTRPSFMYIFVTGSGCTIHARSHSHQPSSTIWLGQTIWCRFSVHFRSVYRRARDSRGDWRGGSVVDTHTPLGSNHAHHAEPHTQSTTNSFNIRKYLLCRVTDSAASDITISNNRNASNTSTIHMEPFTFAMPEVETDPRIIIRTQRLFYKIPVAFPWNSLSDPVCMTHCVARSYPDV